MAPLTAPAPGPTTTSPDERPVPAGFPPELPPGALPEIDWIHLFACRYGGAIDGARPSPHQAPRPMYRGPRSPFRGQTTTTVAPMSSTSGGRWYSKAYVQGGGRLEGYSHTDGGRWDRAAPEIGGGVLDGRVLVVPRERLEQAFRICQWWLAIAERPGIVEWSPAFGTGPAGCFYGVRVLARELCWGRLAYVLGSVWLVETGRGPDRNHCTVSDISGNVFTSTPGALHHVGCSGLVESLLLPKGPWRSHPTRLR